MSKPDQPENQKAATKDGADESAKTKAADKVAVETKKGDLPKDETGGRKEGRDPTRYNDWEMKGRCIDF